MNNLPQTQRCAVIPGDGVGGEVVDSALAVLARLGELDPTLAIETESFPWGSDYHAEHGAMMPADALDVLDRFDAIFFGAVGWPTVADDVTLWGLRLAIVQGFDQCVNVRPITLLPGTAGPLAGRGAAEIDFVVVRENSEGEYSGAGGRSHRGLESELAVQTSIFSRRAIDRVARYALDLAASRPASHLTSVTKSNASQYASVLWDEVVAAAAAERPEVAFDSVLVDAAAAHLVLDPGRFDVLVASNLHADILSDLTAALAGSLGVAASGNYHLDGDHPSMFEPVHGSAPDIAGKGIANPVAALFCLAMMLEHLGHEGAGATVRAAVEETCAAGILTPDLGGEAGTAEVTAAVIEAVARLHSPAPTTNKEQQ
ncbi:MAG TPA: tartrate dehydrogenase [Solirubrobacterales bacterium]|nr:tartrate dehydrogenase [Solirubrobacterales bacterium]